MLFDRISKYYVSLAGNIDLQTLYMSLYAIKAKSSLLCCTRDVSLNERICFGSKFATHFFGARKTLIYQGNSKLFTLEISCTFFYVSVPSFLGLFPTKIRVDQSYDIHINTWWTIQRAIEHRHRFPYYNFPKHLANSQAIHFPQTSLYLLSNHWFMASAFSSFNLSRTVPAPKARRVHFPFFPPIFPSSRVPLSRARTKSHYTPRLITIIYNRVV